MSALSPFLSVFHLIGLGLAVGAATVKVVLLYTSFRDVSLIPAYLKVTKPITRTIITGLALLTLSGIGWLVLGYPFTTLLVIKLLLVAALWVIGPVIDNAIEPRFARAAAEAGASRTPALVQAQKQFLAFECAATLLFYAIIFLWVLR